MIRSIHRAHRLFGHTVPTLVLLASLLTNPTAAGEIEYRRFDQDPRLNNLEHLPGYAPGPEVGLGRIETSGSGPRAMVFIAGAQFGAEAYRAFLERHSEEFTIHAVTLAGFAGTPAPPMPPAGTSYGALTWLRAAQRAVESLIATEGLIRPVVVGHWIGGADVAMRLALERPERVGALVVLAGVPRWPLPGNQATSLEGRIALVDRGLAPQWFRTVTEETWDDNNFLPRDYAVHPVRGLQLWRLAEAAPLPVKIRYSLEARAQDLAQEAARLSVPTLVVEPGFDEAFFSGPHDSSYMRWFCHDGWEGVAESNEHIERVRIPGARVFLMEDSPEALDSHLAAFLRKADVLRRQAPAR